jgi:hypothetical protein
VLVEADPDRLGFRVEVVSGGVDWGAAAGDAFACLEEDAVVSTAGIARFDRSEETVELQLRVNKGILGVMTWTTPKSGRPVVVRDLLVRVEE